jgi:hypothetical protein
MDREILRLSVVTAQAVAHAVAGLSMSALVACVAVRARSKENQTRGLISATWSHEEHALLVADPVQACGLGSPRYTAGR